MSSLKITEEDIPRLDGLIALVTGMSAHSPFSHPTTKPTHKPGGASGIGLSTIRTLAAKGAQTYILDVAPPTEATPSTSTFIQCDTTSWPALMHAFKQAGHVDIAIANAGVSEDAPLFDDQLDPTTGELQEPNFRVLDVNFRGVVMFVKLAVSYMRRQKSGGSVVITASATAYAPEQNLPVYSATKHGVCCAIDPPESPWRGKRFGFSDFLLV